MTQLLSPPVSGVTTNFGHEVIRVAGAHGSLTLKSDLPCDATMTRCVFAANAAGASVPVTTVTDSVSSSYAAATALGSVAGKAPVPSGTLQSAAVGGSSSGGSSITVVFGNIVQDPVVTIQLWKP